MELRSGQLNSPSLVSRCNQLDFFRSVSVTGNRQPISKDRLPVSMIGWHVARHCAAGDGEGAPIFYQNGVDV